MCATQMEVWLSISFQTNAAPRVPTPRDAVGSYIFAHLPLRHQTCCNRELQYVFK